jgi:hypothetical protein
MVFNIGVGLPWKRAHKPLPSNYDNSLKRLNGQLRRLRQQPEVLKEYDKISSGQLQQGIIESVTELKRPGERVHYLPHDTVIRKNAITTKVRVVYDVSSKESKRAVSLNDCLHVDPSLTRQLFHVLSPSQWHGAPFRALARGEGTNSARLFTPGEREALAKSKVHQ